MHHAPRAPRSRRRPVVAAAGAVLALLAGCAPSSPGPAEAVPEAVVRHNIVGTALLSQQKWDDARREFEAGLRARPDDAVLLTNVAVTLMQQGREDEAAKYLEHALLSDPDSLHAHYDLGLIDKNRGDLDGAVEHFSAVVKADPDDVAARYNLATALARLDRRDEAEKEFRAALERDPVHVSSLYGLGRLLLQEGKKSEGQELISLSQKIRAETGGETAMGMQYGEQGPYALGVDYPGGGLEAPLAIEVVFRLAEPPPPGGREAPASAGELPAAAAAVTAARLGGESGIAILASEALGDRVWRYAPGEQRRELGDPAPEQRRIRSLAAGGVDGDGRVEIVCLLERAPGVARGPAWSLAMLRVDDAGAYSWSTPRGVGDPSDAGLAQAFTANEVGPAALTLVDADHDGDLDVFACFGSDRGSGCLLGDNDGTGEFRTRWSDTGIALGPMRGESIDLAFSDVDNDRDVDLLVAEPGGIHLFANQRNGSFEDVTQHAGLGGSIRNAGSLCVADLDKNGFMDLVAGTARGPVVLLNRRGRFAPARVGEAAVKATSESGFPEEGRAVVLDYDNDGFLDLAAAVGGRLHFFRNLGRARWRDTTAEVVPEAVAGQPAIAADVDGDGDPDLTLSVPLGILRNDGGNANHWADVELRGERDNRSGIGTKVEILSGALQQKFEVERPLPVHAGLGARDGVDAVRLVWPGGVLQDELHLPAGQPTEIAQLDRKGTSCPLLYAWRDGGWRFVTDFLGGCAIGYRHSPTELNVPDTDEYVKVEGGLTVNDGDLRLRINNQLEEVLWFDRVELLTVDHPANAEVYPDERLMPGPPWPEFRLFASPDVRPIAAAWDVDHGRDVTAWLRERDRRFVEGFRLLPFKGYAEPHTLELDLGDLPVTGRIVLLLDGWIDYADSTSNIAAWQAGVSLVPPRLYAADGRGGWRELAGRMGFPAGLPKTMTVDLGGALDARDHRIRIMTTMRIYWDRARVMVGGERVPLRVRRLAARRAELRFGGFPEETSPDGLPPFAYDPRRVDDSSPWKAHAGRYTAFGDVTDRLREIDDRFVTTRGGDEIELWFESPAPPEAGWTRTYLLYADGFGKDMDPNSAASDRVAPIPFHGMPVYPYPEGVAPPVVEAEDSPVRVVPPGDDGLPGAVPLVLRTREP